MGGKPQGEKGEGPEREREGGWGRRGGERGREKRERKRGKRGGFGGGKEGLWADLAQRGKEGFFFSFLFFKLP